MGLILNKKLKLTNGYVGNDIYIRMRYEIAYDNNIFVRWNFFKDKDAYVNNVFPIEVVGLANHTNFTYDPINDSCKILSLVHEKVIAELSKEYVLEDESVITYIDAADISIVDLP